jgi:hypothetical protein
LVWAIRGRAESSDASLGKCFLSVLLADNMWDHHDWSHFRVYYVVLDASLEHLRSP